MSKQYEVLGHIHQILEIPHWAQELLAAEKTPTLAMALPVYKKLVELWKSLALSIPEMSHYIGLGVAKIMEYVSKGRRNKIYALAMSEFTYYYDIGPSLMQYVSSQPPNKVPVDGGTVGAE